MTLALTPVQQQLIELKLRQAPTGKLLLAQTRPGLILNMGTAVPSSGKITIWAQSALTYPASAGTELETETPLLPSSDPQTPPAIMTSNKELLEIASTSAHALQLASGPQESKISSLLKLTITQVFLLSTSTSGVNRLFYYLTISYHTGELKAIILSLIKFIKDRVYGQLF